MQPSGRLTIARMCSQDFIRLLGALPESKHQLGSGQGNLSHFTCRQLTRGVGGVENPHGDVGQRHPDRADLAGSLRRVHAEGHHRFGQ